MKYFIKCSYKQLTLKRGLDNVNLNLKVKSKMSKKKTTLKEKNYSLVAFLL